MDKIFHTEKVYIIKARSWLKEAGWDADYIDNLDSRQLAAISDAYGSLRRQSTKSDLINAASAIMGDLMREKGNSEGKTYSKPVAMPYRKV